MIEPKEPVLPRPVLLICEGIDCLEPVTLEDFYWNGHCFCSAKCKHDMLEHYDVESQRQADREG